MVYQERFLLSVQFSALAKIWAARLMMFKVKQRIHDDDQKMTDDWLDHLFENLCLTLHFYDLCLKVHQLPFPDGQLDN